MYRSWRQVSVTVWHNHSFRDHGVHEMYSKRIHATWFGIHFFLLTAVCLAGVFWLIAEGSTILPSACNEYARKAELSATWCLGKEAEASNPVRRGIATYLHAAGIQAGYSFFAPNVPSQHRLTLELLYEDGRVEYESPHVRGKTAALRLESLLDRLPRNVTNRFERCSSKCWRSPSGASTRT